MIGSAVDPSGRDSLVAAVEEALERAEGRPAAVVVVRLRKLASIERLRGREAVEHVLAAVGERLARDSAACGGTLVRLGDGAFGLVAEGTEEEVEEAVERLIATASRSVQLAEGALYTPANAGICPLAGALGDGAAHVDRAMGALQRAMSRGPGSVELASEARVERAVEAWEMRSLLEEAGLRGELAVEYQPIHALDGAPTGKVEALLRWTSPVLGRVSPDRFIPLLEESGLIRTTGEWVLRQACASARRWREQTRRPVRVAVNLSPVQLASGEFTASAARVLEETGCPASWLELEVTEGAVMRDVARSGRRLAALAAMGFTIAIDDFGAGYSSLGQLANLPVDDIKIDRSLIAGVPDGGRRARIVKAVIALAEALEVGLTCEGVEQAAQAQWLAGFPGIRVQGFFFSRPMRADDVAAFLQGEG